MAQAKPASSSTKMASGPGRKLAAPKAGTAAKASRKINPRATAKPAAKKPAAAKPATAPKAKTKLVRDSFTIPKAEYAVLEALKQRGLSLARSVKKSELLRAGIAALNGMNDTTFLDAVNAVPSLKTGRPRHT
jgi:hypothetical protein